MADVFPAINARFKADRACVRLCRQLFDTVAPENAQAPFASFEQNGGEDVSTFGIDADRLDCVFVVHSGDIQQGKARAMAEAIMRAFDSSKLVSGDARISMHRVTPPSVEREEMLYRISIIYDVFVVLESQTPAVLGFG